MITWMTLHKIDTYIILCTVTIGVCILIAAWPAFFFHVFVQDLYLNMWSNMFAPSALTLAAVGFAYLKGKWHRAELHDKAMRQSAAHHEELKQHITRTASQ